MFDKKHQKLSLVIGAGAVVLAAIAGCAPGGSAPTTSTGSGGSGGAVSTDVAAAGNVTLTVWDQNNSGGINTAMQQLNAAFMKMYPNVKIVRNTQSFNDLKTSLKLALQSNNPPDVVQANQGYPDMGAFVQANLLIPIDKYAKVYGWNSYYPAQLLELNKFTPDGKTWATGNLYGISQTGEMVGVYYNKAELAKLGLQPPTTLTELESDLAAVKKAGDLPMQWGDNDLGAGIHIFGVIQDAVAGKTAVRNLVFNQGGAWTDPTTVQAATVFSSWAKQGYMPKGALGYTDDQAATLFAKGQGVFFISGTWEMSSVEQGLGNSGVGFTLLNGANATGPETQGGEGLDFAITSGSKHPDVAAAYINFICTAGASQTLINTSNFPAVPPASWAPTPGTLDAAVLDQWKKISADDGLTPYLDYTTPTFFNTLSAQAQDLFGGKATPQQFTQALQQDYAKFQASRS